MGNPNEEDLRRLSRKDFLLLGGAGLGGIIGVLGALNSEITSYKLHSSKSVKQEPNLIKNTSPPLTETDRGLQTNQEQLISDLENRIVTANLIGTTGAILFIACSMVFFREKRNKQR